MKGEKISSTDHTQGIRTSRVDRPPESKDEGIEPAPLTENYNMIASLKLAT